jgi:hypothetical protein
MVVHDLEVSPVIEDAIDSPIRAAAVDLTIAVSLTDRALDLATREAPFAEAFLGVIRPDEAFDGHRRSSSASPRSFVNMTGEVTPPLGWNSRAAVNAVKDSVFDRVRLRVQEELGKPRCSS